MSIQEIVKMVVEELKVDQEKYLELLGNEDYGEIENELFKWLAPEYCKEAEAKCQSNKRDLEKDIRI